MKTSSTTVIINAGTKVVNNTNIGITYSSDIAQALSILIDGGHYKHAVPVGIKAIRRNDQQTLRQLVDAAHDDTGLIEALEKETGENLSYLADEF